MSEIRCESPICITKDQIRGRMFTPHPNATGMATKWCPECIRVTGEVQYFSQQTAEMIRGVYHSYIDTNLPSDTKNFLTAYTQELMQRLGAEL